MVQSTQELQQLIQRFWESVPSAWHIVRGVIRKIAHDHHGLSVEQFQALRRIRKGMNSVSAIALDSHTSISATSRVVDGLVKKGYVARSRLTEDRRRVPLEITISGEKAIQEIFTKAECWLGDRFRALSIEDAMIVEKGLEILRKVIVMEAHNNEHNE